MGYENNLFHTLKVNVPQYLWQNKSTFAPDLIENLLHNMKKAVITTLSVLIILLSVACNNRTDHNKHLVEIDSLITPRPDTALLMLKTLPANCLQTRADSAYYALLMTEARDKNFIIQTEDSLIQSALTYYNSTNDIEKRARAYYYSGCVYRDSRKKKEAMTQFLMAEPLAEEAGEKRLLSLIYFNIGHLYYSQNLNTQADSTYWLAAQIGEKDPVLQASVLTQRGLIRMEKGEAAYPEAEKMILKALSIAENSPNIRLKESIFSSLCLLYNWMENGEKAIEFAKRNLGVQENPDTCYKAFELLGSAYYQISQYDSARYYLQKALPTKHSATKASIYMYLADIAKEQGDLATSLEMERKYSAYLNNMQNNSQTDEIITAEKNLRFSSLPEHNTQSIPLILSIGIPLTFIGILAIFIRVLFLRKKQNTPHPIAAYIPEEIHEEILEQSDVYKKMKRIIQSYKTNDSSAEIMHKDDWRQLITETDKCWGNITSTLQSRHGLTEDEIRLCCLYLTDLPTSHLGYVLNCTRDTVYKRADRILEQRMGFAHKEASLKNVLKELH